MTIANEVYSDPRIQEAKDLITSVFKEKQANFTSLRPPTSNKAAESYEEMLKSLSANRGGKLFYDYIGSGFGSGPFVELADGSTKYDFIIGIGVHYMGHSHIGMMEALIDGAISNTVMQGHLQQNSDSKKLIDLLLKEANTYGADLNHCFLTSSGAMALENSLKIAMQKRNPANRVFAFNKCFHGRTMAVAQITDKAKYRSGLPSILDVDYLDFYDAENHEASIERTLMQIDAAIEKYPGEHAAIVCELILGEGGSWPGNKEYFEKVFSKLKEHNITIIADEVQSFGRTEKLFAFQYFEMDKHIDIVTIGKNSQVCATLFRNDHKPRPGLISQTFTSSSTAIRAGHYIINEIVNNGYLGKDGKINKTHDYFKSKLEELHKKHPDKIKGPYGIGAMVAMTLFNGDADKTLKFSHQLFKNGVMAFVAGAKPTRLRMLLPMGVIEHKHIDEVVTIIEKTLGEI